MRPAMLSSVHTYISQAIEVKDLEANSSVISAVYEVLREVNLFGSFCTKKHKLHVLSELLMESSWWTAFSFLMNIFNFSMHERVVRSFIQAPVFVVGFIKTTLEGKSHLWM